MKLLKNMKENKETLLKYFRDLYESEKTAHEIYVNFLQTSKDEKINRKIEAIKRDEEKHMGIVKKIISLVEESS